ncbi:hypothetical protein R5W23_000615 [Gemmata sp. JC673]|uniref:Lipoprotein n=2 Tax=Gemmata algarum TaxID=2975278 RepID=A0ABU5EWR4_9BACT|nr:hypothetical protein [Gemmata algarum]MDY3559621.1 hypothetical protein [Gemmata algarum]
MNRNRVGRWARLAVWTSVLAVGSIGCNPLNIAAFIFAREDKVPARYPLAFKEGPKKDKDEIVVVLLPQIAPGSNNPQFASATHDLADRLAKALPEMAKENKDKKKVKIVSQTEVGRFKSKNPNWKQMSTGELGQKLGADFVLEIYLDQLRLHDPNTRSIYDGRAEVFVSIYEIGADGGEMKDKYPLSFSYPKTARSVDSYPSESAFKALFIENLAIEIAKMHTDHKPSNSIADAR